MHCAGFKPTSRPVATNIMEKHSTALRGIVGVAVLAVPPIVQRISSRSENNNNIE